MKKVIIGILAVSMGHAMFFDNSIERWEGDCQPGGVMNPGSCMIAASQYLAGEWEDANGGGLIKIKGSKEEHRKKALILFKRACKAGEKRGCAKAKALEK